MSKMLPLVLIVLCASMIIVLFSYVYIAVTPDTYVPKGPKNAEMFGRVLQESRCVGSLSSGDCQEVPYPAIVTIGFQGYGEVVAHHMMDIYTKDDGSYTAALPASTGGSYIVSAAHDSATCQSVRTPVSPGESLEVDIFCREMAPGR